MQANSWHKLFHFHLSFYIWKAWKGKEKLQKFEYLENKKSLLDETPSNYYREGFMREMMSVVCVQVKKIVLASETKMVQKRRFRRDFFWPIFLKYMPILRQKLDFLLLHSVCVCTYHQNVKLMFNTVNKSHDYKGVLTLCVCSAENSDCILRHCDLCPEQTGQSGSQFFKGKIALELHDWWLN